MNDEERVEIWCSTAEAVTRLAEAGDKISQQALTKYITTHPDIPRRPSTSDARVTEIEFTALTAHRAANVIAGERKAKRTGRRNPEADDLRMRERRATAELREFQLAERKGELVTRAEVLRAVHGAGVALAQVLQRSRFERADALQRAPDARTKASLLEKQDVALQQAFADALRALSNGDASQDGDETGDADANDSAGDAAAA
jgi:hypothetical protein